MNHKFLTGFESNCVEYWAPITDQAVNGVKPGYWISTCGRIWSEKSHKFLSYYNDKDGYYVTTLPGREVQSIYRRIHRIEMLTFAYFDGCEQFEVNHKDGIKHNLHISNLEWATIVENKRHACETGLRENTYGDNSNLATLTEEQVRHICYLYSNGMSVPEIYTTIGGICSKTHIYRLISGKCRTKVAKELGLI